MNNCKNTRFPRHNYACSIRLYIITFVCCVLSVDAVAQSMLVQALSKTFHEYDELCYDVEYSIKSISKGDTLQFDYFVKLGKNENSLDFMVEVNDSLSHVYHNGVLLTVNSKSSQFNMTTIDASELNSTRKYLFRPITDRTFTSIILDSTEISHVQTTTSNSVYRVDIASEELEELYYLIYINNTTGRISQYSLHANFASIELWECWKLRDYNIDPSKQGTVSQFFFDVLREYSHDNIVPELHIATSTDTLALASLIDNDFISLQEDTLKISSLDNNNVYILDFWYMACPPCIKSIPVVEEVKSEYEASQLRIISINPVDEDKEAIKRFMDNNNVNGPVYTRSVQSGRSFQVSTYPTYLIFNRKLKLVGYETGYSNDLKDRLSRLINEALKE